MAARSSTAITAVCALIPLVPCYAFAQKTKPIIAPGALECGTPEVNTAEFAEADAQLKRGMLRGDIPTVEKARINVFFHVITETEAVQPTKTWPPRPPTIAVGQVNRTHLMNQVDILNRHYSQHGLTFVFTGVDYTINPSWYAGCSDSAVWDAMSQQLDGTENRLNIYICRPDGISGQARIPQLRERHGGARDGVVLSETVLPGWYEGSATRNEGKSAVHEVGHYLGLFHTHSGCAEGDLVEDTPGQRGAAFGCQLNANTCTEIPDQPDPIHNFMSYSDDSCRSEFTEGQIARMKRTISRFRPGFGMQ